MLRFVGAAPAPSAAAARAAASTHRTSAAPYHLPAVGGSPSYDTSSSGTILNASGLSPPPGLLAIGDAPAGEPHPSGVMAVGGSHPSASAAGGWHPSAQQIADRVAPSAPGGSSLGFPQAAFISNVEN